MKKLKTIKEWLSEIPDEKIRKAAFKNLDKEDELEMIPSLSLAIAGAFTWSKSPEGNAYWVKFYSTLPR